MPFDFDALILSIAFDILSIVIFVEHRGSVNCRSWNSGISPAPSFSNTLAKKEFSIFSIFVFPGCHLLGFHLAFRALPSLIWSSPLSGNSSKRVY